METPAKRAKEDEESVSMFIGGISWNVSDADVVEFLNSLGCGNVDSVRILLRDDGKSRG